MHKNWIDMTADLSVALKEVRAGAPDVMKGFSAIAQAALKANALDSKTKELIALAISVATRCDGCIGFHAEAAVKHGATRDEVMETMGMAIYMGAGPSVMYAASRRSRPTTSSPRRRPAAASLPPCGISTDGCVLWRAAPYGHGTPFQRVSMAHSIQEVLQAFAQGETRRRHR